MGNFCNLFFVFCFIFFILIHALRGECNCSGGNTGVNIFISIHASQVGCNPAGARYKRGDRKFQFMHPRWDATVQGGLVTLNPVNFNSCIPGGMQLQDLDLILLYILYLVFTHYYFIQSYLIITSILFIFWCECPSVFMCT